MTELSKGADGKYYYDSGNGEYEEFVAPVGMRVVETGDGIKVVAGTEGNEEVINLVDGAEYSRQRDETSSEEYFRNKRQKLKRREALQRQFELMDLPVEPGVGCNIMYIKDEQFEELNLKYREAFARGEQTQSDFQPLISYRHQLKRPVLAAEVGKIGEQIVCLEAGYGGKIINVPEKLEE